MYVWCQHSSPFACVHCNHHSLNLTLVDPWYWPRPWINWHTISNATLDSQKNNWLNFSVLQSENICIKSSCMTRSVNVETKRCQWWFSLLCCNGWSRETMCGCYRESILEPFCTIGWWVIWATVFLCLVLYILSYRNSPIPNAFTSLVIVLFSYYVVVWHNDASEHLFNVVCMIRCFILVL